MLNTVGRAGRTRPKFPTTGQSLMVLGGASVSFSKSECGDHATATLSAKKENDDALTSPTIEVIQTQIGEEDWLGVTYNDTLKRLEFTTLNHMIEDGKTYNATVNIFDSTCPNSPQTATIALTGTQGPQYPGSALYWNPRPPLPMGVVYSNVDDSFAPPTWVLSNTIDPAYLPGGAKPKWFVGSTSAPSGTTNVGSSLSALTSALSSVANAAAGGTLVIEDQLLGFKVVQTALAKIQIPRRGSSTTGLAIVMSLSRYLGLAPHAMNALPSETNDIYRAKIEFAYTGTQRDLAYFVEFEQHGDCRDWWFIDVEVAIATSPAIVGGVYGKYVTTLVGVGTGDATSPSQLPTRITFDQCHFHGNVLDGVQAWCPNGFRPHGSYITARCCVIRDFMAQSIESHCVSWFNCTGPLHFEDLKLGNSSIEILSGGAHPALGGTFLPDNVTLMRIACYKDPRMRAAAGEIPFPNPSSTIILKNNCEAKFGRNVLWHALVLDGSYMGAQWISFSIKTAGQSANHPYVHTKNLVGRHIITRNAPEGWTLQAQELSVKRCSNIELTQIRTEPLGVGVHVGTGNTGQWMDFFGGFDNIWIEHCVGFPANRSGTGWCISIEGPTRQTNGWTYRGNISGRPTNITGFVYRDGTGTHVNKQGLDDCTSGGYRYTHNLFANKGVNVMPSDPTNVYVTNRSDIGFVSDPSPDTYGDWRLQVTSPGYRTAFDGRDMGPDNDLIESMCARPLAMIAEGYP